MSSFGAKTAKLSHCEFLALDRNVAISLSCFPNRHPRNPDALLDRLTRDDVNNAIKKYWQTDNMFVTIVTDTSEAEPLAGSLRQNLPSPMSYSNIVKAGLPEEVLKTDQIVAEYPLNVENVKIVNSADTFK
jgi:zinc protease